MQYALLYVYDKTQHRLEDDFEQLAKLCPDRSTLVFPTIGVNNGINFHKSAFNLFYSIVSCLETETSELRRMSKIIVMTLFDANQDYGGTRAIRHLFNLINVRNGIANNKTCAICVSSKVDTILDCGHYIMCSRCLVDIVKIGNCCPICKKQIQHAFPCYSVSEIQSCSHTSDKEKILCIPCCHLLESCDACKRNITDKCPICNEDIVALLPFFDS